MTLHTLPSAPAHTEGPSGGMEQAEKRRATLERIQDSVRSVVFTALQHAHEVDDNVPTIAEITDTLAGLDATKQPEYLGQVLRELPEAERYDAIRHFASQSLSLYQKQTELDAMSAETEKRVQLLDMIDQALRNLRQNPDTFGAEVTHGTTTITIGKLVHMLQRAQLDLEHGVSTDQVEADLQL